MTANRFNPLFTPDCTGREVIIGLVYLCIHMFALPLLLPYVQQDFFPDWNSAQANGLYYGFSLFVVAALFMPMLRREFDHLCDRPLTCLSKLLMGYCLWYALSLLTVSLMTTMGWATESANDVAIDQMAMEGYNITLALSVIAAPVIEEVLFRGVVFQSLLKKDRAMAYVVSMLLFGLYHTWQFVYITGDFTYLLDIIQYLPITFAITWAYEASGSLWTAIFFHGSNNYIAMMVMQMM